ncbi:hypothetical protein ACTA71_010655 [Dictyostelium dimigraforme]
MVKLKIILSFLLFILYYNYFTVGSYIFDTKNWSTNGTLSSCIFYDFENNDYYDLRTLTRPEHNTAHTAYFDEPSGGTVGYTVYFNLCHYDLVCPDKLSIGCKKPGLNSIASLSQPYFVTFRSDGITIKYQSIPLSPSSCIANGNRRTLVLILTCEPKVISQVTGTSNQKDFCEFIIYMSSSLVCKNRGILFNEGLFYDLTPMKLSSEYSRSHQITNNDQSRDILFNLFGNTRRCGNFGFLDINYQSCMLTVANKDYNYDIDSRYSTTTKSIMLGSLSQPRAISFINNTISITYSSTTGFKECPLNGNKYTSKYILICDPFTEYYVDKFTSESQCFYQIKIYTKYACPTLRLFKQTQYYDLSPLMLDSTRNYTGTHTTDQNKYEIVFNIGNKVQLCDEPSNSTNFHFACQYDAAGRYLNPIAEANLGQKVTFDLNQVKIEYSSRPTTNCPTNSYKRDFILLFICDENQHYQLVSTIESPTCVYTVTVKTKYVCESTIYYDNFDYTYYDITPIKTTKDSPKTVDIVVGGYPYKLYYSIGSTVNYCANQAEAIPGVDYQSCQYLSGLVIQVGSLKNTSMSIINNGISIIHTTPYDPTRVCQNSRYQRVNILNMVCDLTTTYTVTGASEVANNWACQYIIEIKTKYACPINYAPVLPVIGNPCLFSCTPPGGLNSKNIVSVLLNLGVCFSEINRYGTGAQILLNIFEDTWVSNQNGNDDWSTGQLYKLLLTGKPQTSIQPYISSITHDNLCTYGTNGLSKERNSINDFLIITNDLLEISNRPNSSTKYTYYDGAFTLSIIKLQSTSTGGLGIIKFNGLLCHFSIISNIQTMVIQDYLILCPHYSIPITLDSLTPSTGKIGDTITINGVNLERDSYDVYFNSVGDNNKAKATITSKTYFSVKVIVPNLGFGDALVYTQNILDLKKSNNLSFSYPSPTITKMIIEPFTTGIINRFFVIGQNFGSLNTNVTIYPYIDNIEKEPIYCEIEKYCPSTSKIPSVSESPAAGHPCINSKLYSENSHFFNYSYFDVFVCIKSSLDVGSGIIKVPSPTAIFSFQYYYKAPLLYYTPPGNRVPTDGGSFQLDGKNFPPTQEIIDLGLNKSEIIWNDDNFITFKGTNLTSNNINWKSSKSILFIVPPGFGKSNIVSVTVGRQASTTTYPGDLQESPSGDYPINYQYPAVGNMLAVPTDGGETIVIGSNFIPASLADQINNQPLIGSPHSILFNNVLSSSWTWINSTHVKSIVQKGIGSIYPIVNVGGQRSNETNATPLLFYKGPELDIKKYESFANSDILITGSNFVPTGVSEGSSSSVKIGGTSCNSVTWINSKSIICNVPIGTGDNLNIEVTVGGQVTKLNNYFSYLGECDFLCSNLSNLELEKVINENKKDLVSALLLTGVCLEQIEQYNLTYIENTMESSWIENSIIDDWTSGKFFNYFKSSESYSTVKTLAKYVNPKNPCIYDNKRVKNSLNYLFEIFSDILHLTELSNSSKISYPDSPFETYFHQSSSNPEYGLSIIKFNSVICGFTESTIQDYQSGKVLQSCSIIPIINQAINPTTTLPPPYQYTLSLIGRLFDSSTKIFLSGYECSIIGNIITNPDYTQTLSCLVPSEIESYSDSSITFCNDYSKNNMFNFLIYFNNPFYFEYPVSTVTQIKYPSSGPIQMDSEIQVIGFNFFPFGITTPTIRVFIDDLELTDTISNFATLNGIDSFTFIASGLGSSKNLPMTINDGIILDFSFERPIIDNILPINGDYNSKVTINGNNFRDGQFVKFGDSLADDIEFISNKKIIVSAPFGYINEPVVVYSNDQYSLEEIIFNYPSPIVDKVVLTNYASKLNTTGTNYFTVVGRGLGTYVSEQVEIIIDQEYYASCEFEFCEGFDITDDMDLTELEICQYLNYTNYQYINENFDVLICNFADSIGNNKSISIQVSEFFNQTFSYSYYEPWIEKLTQNSSFANTDGGEIIVINGYNFLPFENLSPYYENNETIAQWLNQSEILIGESYICQSINWTHSLELNCTIPPGIGVNHTIVVKVGLQLSNHTDYLYSYNPPILETINNSTGNETHYYSPTDGNNEITITGNNFIPKELSNQYNENENKTINSILLGQQYCNQTIWINSTTVKCKPMAGIGSNYKIIIKVGKQDSNEAVYFSYEKPILHLKNYTGSTDGKNEITITGSNFIPKELIDNNNFNQSENYIMIGDNKCNETIWINSTSVKCKPIAGTGVNHKVVITIGNQNSNETVYFSYDNPILDIKNYSSPTDGNIEITITGQNFIEDYNQEKHNEADNFVKIGENKCNETLWVNSTTIKCKPTQGIGLDYKITVTVANQQSNENVFFSYEGPTIDIKTLLASTNGSEIIKITGRNFIPSTLSEHYNKEENKNTSVNSVTINNEFCNSITWINSTELTCKPLAGIGANHTISILIGTQKSNEERSFSYKPPKIEEFKYYTAPTHSNKIISITGENFIPIELLSKDNSNSSVLIDNEKCEKIQWIDSTKVSCQVPVGQGKDLSIKVIIENQENEDNQQFSYDKPFIQSINPVKGRCNQEVLITIQGDSFGKNDQTIKIGDNSCHDIQFSPNHTFICKVPIVENSIESIVLLNVGNQYSNDNITYKYYGPPEIKSIGLPSYLSFKGEDIITINGNNFIEFDNGTDEIIIKFNNKQTTINQKTETSIKMKTLGGDEFNIPIQVELNGQLSNIDTSFMYSNPIIQSVTPSKSSSKSNTHITIKGNNLGYLTNTPRITIGSSNCLNIRTETPNEIHCIVMKSSAGTKQLTLTYKNYSPTNSYFTHTNDDDDSDSHDDDDHKDKNVVKDTLLTILGSAIATAAVAAIRILITTIFGGGVSVATTVATTTATGTAIELATIASTATAITSATVEGVAVVSTRVAVIVASASGLVITAIVTATVILISGDTTPSPSPTPTITPTPTPIDNYWVKCMVDYSKLTLQVDNFYGQEVVCIDGNGNSSIFNESFSCQPDLINNSMICIQQHQDGTNSTTTYNNSTLICHIDSTKSCEISPPFIIPHPDDHSNIFDCQYDLIENSLTTYSSNSPLRCYNNETEKYFMMNTTLSCLKDESLSQDKDTISCLADTDDTQIFFFKNSITCMTDYPYSKCIMKSQATPDDNIIPEPTLPPIPSINDNSTCNYDSTNPFSTDLQPTVGTNIKCPTNEIELHYDLSTTFICTDKNTLKNSTYSVSYSTYVCVKTK